MPSKQMVCDYSNDIMVYKNTYKKKRNVEVRKTMLECHNCGSKFVKNTQDVLQHYRTKKCGLDLKQPNLQEKLKNLQEKIKREKIVMVYYTSREYKTNRIVYINDKELHRKYNTKHFKASQVIANWYLDKKYDPQYKVCRDRLHKLYNEEFDDDYVEGEVIVLKPQ